MTTRGSVADDSLAATVTVTVTNTGDRDGAEVVQVYITDVASTVARPARELKGFAKVSLAAGASEQVSVELDQRASPSGQSCTADGRSKPATSSSRSDRTPATFP